MGTVSTADTSVDSAEATRRIVDMFGFEQVLSIIRAQPDDPHKQIDLAQIVFEHYFPGEAFSPTDEECSGSDEESSSGDLVQQRERVLQNLLEKLEYHDWGHFWEELDEDPSGDELLRFLGLTEKHMRFLGIPPRDRQILDTHLKEALFRKACEEY